MGEPLVMRQGLIHNEEQSVEEERKGFEIEGEQFEIPNFGSFTLDEAVILYDIAGVIQEQLAPLHPESTDEEKETHERASLRHIANPRFKLALAAIAYHRKYPQADDVRMKLAAGSANAQDVTLAFLWGDDSPPAVSSPKPQEKSSDTSESSSSGDSGTDSGSTSDAQVVHLSPTGTGG